MGKNYTKEFKRETAELVLDKGYTQKEAREAWGSVNQPLILGALYELLGKTVMVNYWLLRLVE